MTDIHSIYSEPPVWTMPDDDPQYANLAAERPVTDVIEKADTSQLQSEIERLSALDQVAYELERSVVAKAFEVRTSFLDKVTGIHRATGSEGINLEEADEDHDELTDGIVPWESEVSGIDLFNTIKNLFAHYLILPNGAGDTLTLWIIASYAIDSFRIFPKILVSSPEKRCGKTTTMEVLNSVVYRGLPASNVTASVLFRAIEAWSPTLLIDEADTFIHGNSELTGIINSGHTKSGAFVLRSQEVDGEWQPVKFCTWTPMVLAMIQKPPATILDRSIVIELQRKRAEQTVQRLPIDLLDNNKVVRRKLARWADDNADLLKLADPDIPKLSSDRAMDNWRPLLAVADLIGVGDKARLVMVKIGDCNADDLPIEAELLIDIQAVLEGRSRIFSEDLVRSLIADEDRPWCEWRHGQPMTKNSLSKLLSAYRIKPKQIRIGNYKRRGYEADDFADAFARYIPNETGTTVQPASQQGLGSSENGTTLNTVPPPKHPQPSPDKACTTVPLETGSYQEVVDL